MKIFNCFELFFKTKMRSIFYEATVFGDPLSVKYKATNVEFGVFTCISVKTPM